MLGDPCHPQYVATIQEEKSQRVRVGVPYNPSCHGSDAVIKCRRHQRYHWNEKRRFLSDPDFHHDTHVGIVCV